jgi:hypothetical protein
MPDATGIPNPKVISMLARSVPNSSSSVPTRILSAEFQEAIRRRAGEIYIESGMAEGFDVQNWTRAEAEIWKKYEGQSTPRAAVVVSVNGYQYIGEYPLVTAEGYTPGEFGPGAPVPVRFAGDCMYLKRKNGRELNTTVVKRLG